jgi:hypothetical protein
MYCLGALNDIDHKLGMIGLIWLKSVSNIIGGRANAAPRLLIGTKRR